MKIRKDKIIFLALIFLVITCLTQWPVSASVNKKWDWHNVTIGGTSKHKRTIHWCWDESVTDEQKEKWRSWILQAAGNWNKAGVGWTIVYTDDPAKCQVIIEFGNITTPAHVGVVDMPEGWIKKVRMTFDTDLTTNPAGSSASGWGTSGNDTYDPIVVAKHEFGHLLRLNHDYGSDDKMNVKGPGYHNHTLSSEDKKEAWSSYGSTGRRGTNVFRPFGYFMSDNNDTVEIPVGALPESAEIRFSNIINWDILNRASVPEGYGYIAVAVQIESEVRTFARPITISMAYTDEEVGGGFVECYSSVFYPPLVESELKAFVFNYSTFSWDLIPESRVNPDTNTVTFRTDKVGIFGISGPERKKFLDLLVEVWESVVEEYPMVGTVLGNQRVNFYVDGEVGGHLIVENGNVVGGGEDKLKDQTMNVYITEGTIEEVLKGELTLTEALNEGKIKYEGVGLFNSIKLGVVNLVYRMYSFFSTIF